MGLEKIRKKLLFTLLAVTIIALLIVIPKLDLSKTDMKLNVKKITGAVTEIDNYETKSFISNTKQTFTNNPAYLIIALICVAWLFGIFKR